MQRNQPSSWFNSIAKTVYIYTQIEKIFESAAQEYYVFFLFVELFLGYYTSANVVAAVT